VLAMDDNSRVLIGRRKGSSGGGQWALPGGWLEVGESFEECALRELREETGLSPVSDSTCVPLDISPTNNIFSAGSVKHSVSVFVLIRVSGEVEPQVLEPEKCHEWRWVDLDLSAMNEWPTPRFPSFELLIQRKEAFVSAAHVAGKLALLEQAD
jgi:8-oxo-dGTP diphosphatase